MIKENSQESKFIRNKDRDFRENYLKSFIHKSSFTSRTLNKFKNHTIFLNSNNMMKNKKDKAIENSEKLKHE